MYIPHVCVYISFDPSVRFIEIGFISGLRCFTGVPGSMKCPVATASAIASLFVISILIWNMMFLWASDC